jgi:hypothetical protein
MVLGPKKEWFGYRRKKAAHGGHEPQLIDITGRDGRIRTADFLLPKHQPEASQPPLSVITELKTCDIQNITTIMTQKS